MPAQQINPADDPRKAQAEQAGPEQEEEDYGLELSGEAILAADDRPMVRVAVRSWGGHVFVRTISGYERDQFELYMARHVDPESNELVGCNWRAGLLARCLSDSKGELLFSEDDIEALGRKSGAELDTLFAVARRLNRLKQKDVDEIKKAFGAAPRGCSPRDSAASSEAGATPTSASES